MSPQSLLPQEHREGSGSGAGEHLSGMGARPHKMGACPHKWVRALIKWVRALMMMGAHSLGWGRALLEKGLFQKCHNEL